MDFESFQSNIKILDPKEGNEIREKYIEKFIDTTKLRYAEMIGQRRRLNLILQ